MIINLERFGPNVHVSKVGPKQLFLLLSDLHWDNPHCDRDLLKNHLDEAVRRNAAIVVNGDFFCLMQGKGDPRRSKDDIRPEHNNGRYLDSINAARTIFNKCYFDRENCHQGLQCLRHYRYDVDPDTKQFSKTPLHDIYSHGADAFKYLGLVVNEPRKSVTKQAVRQPAGSWMG